MPQTVMELYEAASRLPEDERAELAEMIEATLETRSDSLHPAWAAEIRRRIEEIDSGEVKMVPWSEVCERIEAKLQSDRISHA